jgi:hypothetical protein
MNTVTDIKALCDYDINSALLAVKEIAIAETENARFDGNS